MPRKRPEEASKGVPRLGAQNALRGRAHARQSVPQPIEYNGGATTPSARGSDAEGAHRADRGSPKTRDEPLPLIGRVRPLRKPSSAPGWPGEFHMHHEAPHRHPGPTAHPMITRPCSVGARPPVDSRTRCRATGIRPIARRVITAARSRDPLVRPRPHPRPDPTAYPMITGRSPLGSRPASRCHCGPS